MRQHLDELIADLDRRIATLEAEIAAVLEESAWAESLACPTSAPGIGLVTASWLRQKSDDAWQRRSRSGSVASLTAA